MTAPGDAYRSQGRGVLPFHLARNTSGGAGGWPPAPVATRKGRETPHSAALRLAKSSGKCVSADITGSGVSPPSAQSEPFVMV